MSCERRWRFWVDEQMGWKEKEEVVAEGTGGEGRGREDVDRNLNLFMAKC